MTGPSAVSAIKVNGGRSYHRVRAGEEVELAPRRSPSSAWTCPLRRPPRTWSTSTSTSLLRRHVHPGLARDLGPRSASAGTSPRCGDHLGTLQAVRGAAPVEEAAAAAGRRRGTRASSRSPTRPPPSSRAASSPRRRRRQLGYGQRVPASGTSRHRTRPSPRTAGWSPFVEDAGSTARVTVGFPGAPVARSEP